MLSVRLLYPFESALHAEGLSIDSCLEQARIPRDVYERPDSRIAFADVERFLEAASARTSSMALGLEAARRHDAGQFQLLEYLAASGETLRSAIDAMLQHQALLSSANVFCLEQLPDGCLLRYLPASSPTCWVDFVIGTLTLTSLRVLGPYAGHSDRAFVWFAYPRPEDTRHHRAIFGNKLVFEAPATGLLLHPEWMDLPMQRANPRLWSLFDRLLAEQGQGTDGQTAPQVEQLITAAFMEGRAIGLPQVARQLGASSSTLKRKLRREGLSYSELVERVRRLTGMRLLEETDLSVKEVAVRLGYAHVSTFSRACRRWIGRSPAAHRHKP